MKISIDNLRCLVIGREDDGGVYSVEIDCSAWKKNYPQLVEYRVEATSPGGIIYFPVVRMEGDVLVWEITKYDTAVNGMGSYQVVATGANAERKTSDEGEFIVGSVMKGSSDDTPVDPSKPWTDKVMEAAKRAEEAGGLTNEDIEKALNGYLTEHPIQSGATPEQVKQINANTKAVEELQKKSETDPTVPEWAKQESKPGYTADEVGADPEGTAAGEIGKHNTQTDSHEDIRALIDGLAKRLNAIADSDDTTLDQMSEVVAYIKSNKSLIDQITTNKINTSDIVDNLVTNVSSKVLSAAQGVALKGLIDAAVTQLNEAIDAQGKTINTLNNNKLDASALPTAVNAALEQAKNSGEFKGDPGDPGAPGAPGYTPVKGTDYWTQEDKAGIVSDVLAALPNASGVSF